MAAGLPTSVIVAVEFSAGVWTDISTSVKGDSIEIRVGRQDAASDSQPGVLSLDLDNIDGTFTPDNPTSTYYPNFVEGKRVRVQVVKSASTYTRFVGRIVALEPDFPAVPTKAVTRLTAVDSLGDLQRITLRPMLLNTPAGLSYPLNDTAARQGAAAFAGGEYPDLTVRNVAATGGVDFAADSSLDVDGTAYVTLRAGKGLWHASPAYPPANSGYSPTLFGYVKLTDGSYGEVMSFSVGRRSSATDYMSVSFGASGLTANLYQGGALNKSIGPLAVVPGEWLALTLALYDYHFGPTYNFDLYARGEATGDVNVSSSTATAQINPDCISIGGSIDMSCARFRPMHTDGGSIYSSYSAIAGRSTLTTALSTFATECNVSSLSASLAWTSTPTPNVSTPLKLGERTAFEVLLDIARSQAGIVYQTYSTSATQAVNVVALADSRPTTVALTIDAENDGIGGPNLTRDIQGVGGSAVANSTLNSVTVTDATLAATYGTTPVTVDTVQGDANALYSAASNLLAQGGASNRLRLSSITVDLATAQNDLYASFFALTPGARLRYSNLPSTYFGRTYIDGYAEGWVERPGVHGYEVTFDVSPADAPSEGRFDTARWAFGDGVCTGTSGTAVGTTSTGTLVLTWTGGAALSTTAGDYPLDLNWNGERVTVTSAPAGSSSPQTLTITARGVAPTVARSHSAGEAVDLWDAGRWAY